MELFKRLKEQYWQALAAGPRKLVLGCLAAVCILLAVLASQSGGVQTVSSSDWLGAATSFGSPSSKTTQSSAPAGSSTLTFGQGSTISDAQPGAIVMVQVVGRVRKPGVFTLRAGSRVIDAIFAAGGFEANADQASVNLARPLNDGEQILVLAQNSPASQSLSYASGGGTGTKTVNINLADAATLDGLPGIGPTLAQRIVDYRQANGGYRSLDDLGKVAGIGNSLLNKLRPLVSL